MNSQLTDGESGWIYNRFRFYSPRLGVYSSQDPLGLAGGVGTSQGYVFHPGCWVDPLGLKTHQVMDKTLQKQVDQLTSEQKGQLGERIAQKLFPNQFDEADPRTIYTSQKFFNKSGSLQGRISDITLFDGTIVESKFVKKLGMSRQLTDAIHQSMTHGGGPLELVVAPGTKLSKPLQAQIKAGNINLRRVTEKQVADTLGELF